MDRVNFCNDSGHDDSTKNIVVVIIIIIIFLAYQHKACRQLKIKQEMTIIIMQCLTRHVSVIRMTNRYSLPNPNVDRMTI